MFPAHCDTLKKKMSKSSRLRCPRLCGAGSVSGWVRAVRLGSARRDARIRPSVRIPQQAGAATEPRVRTHAPSCTTTAQAPAHARPRPSPQAGVWVPVGVSAPGLMLRINIKVEVMSQVARFVLWLRVAFCMKKTL